jgi:hypothetical protein
MDYLHYLPMFPLLLKTDDYDSASGKAGNWLHDVCVWNNNLRD